MMRACCLAIGLLLVAAAPLQAREVTVSAGAVETRDTNQHSYSWSLDYQHRLGAHSGVGLTYLNEGHPGTHHRDGIGGQFWLRSPTPAEGLSFAGGLGPYYYFDTTRAVNDDSHRNLHGWGTLASLSANWNFPSRWYMQLRWNKVFAHNGPDSNTVLLGLGYRLGSPAPQAAAGSDWLSNMPSRKELTLLGGRTILNSLHSERTDAAGLEFRRRLGNYSDWTVSFLNEGDVNLLRRSGIATQFWLVRPFQNQRLALGVGAGPYFALQKRDRIDGGDDGDRLSGLISLSARYQLSDQWLARMTWNRVVSQYHRDTDVLLIGAGYAF